MAEAGAMHPGSMAAVLRLEDEQVAALCSQAAAESGDVVQVANYNSPGQVVISGGPAGVTAASALAKAAGGRVMPLAVSVAAHSALMTHAAQAFAARVAATRFCKPTLPIIGNVQAAALTTPDAIRTELVAQLTAPVRWTASIAGAGGGRRPALCRDRAGHGADGPGEADRGRCGDGERGDAG